MDFFSLGSKLGYPDLNALVYLLRKFKRLTSDLTLGSNRIESDYGVYNVTGGLTSVGGNFILEDNVTIYSNDVLLNCFYTFIFTVVDVNLSGTVNKRFISVTGDIGDNGILEITLSPDLLESDEVILPDFKVDIVFDEHEYYTPVSSLDITLTVDKEQINVGESNTVTATVLDDSGEPVEDLELQFNFNGDIVTDTTGSDGVASAEYTGTGVGWVNVLVNGKSIQFYDGNILTAEFTGNNIKIGYGNPYQGLYSNGNVLIDWGDGTTSTVNNPSTSIGHIYKDGLSSHEIKFVGEVTKLGYQCFYMCHGLTSISIPNTVTEIDDGCFFRCTHLTSVEFISNSVTRIGVSCFGWCTGLTSITIPNSVTTLGGYCFDECSALIDYQLYWTGNSIIWYNSNKMPNNTDTIFTIPYETSRDYIENNYPSNKLRERGLNLELTSDKPIIKSSETSTITATLTHEDAPLTSKTLSYQIKHGDTIITSGTKTTNNNGQATIQYTGTGIGEVTIEVKYGNTTQNSLNIIDATYIDNGVNYLNRLTSTTVTNGMQLTAPVDNYGMMYFSENSSSSSTFYLAPNSVFEFDIVDYDGTFIIRCDSTSENQQLFTHADVTAPCHVKIVNNGTTIDYYINGVKYTKTGVTRDNRRLTMRINTDSSLVYANLCYYVK